MNDKTQVPIGWIFAMVGALITAFFFAGGVIVRGAQVEDKVNSASERIVKLETTQDKQQADLQEIKEGVAWIKGNMKRAR